MKAVKTINRISRISGYIGGVAIIILMALMVIDVLLRKFFGSPIIGATEVAQLIMVFIFAGVALTTLENRHVKIDTFMGLFPVKVQAILDIVIYVLTCGFFLWLGWQAYRMSILSGKMNQIYSLLQIPIYPFLWVLAACFFLACLAVVGLLINKVTEVMSK